MGTPSRSHSEHGSRKARASPAPQRRTASSSVVDSPQGSGQGGAAAHTRGRPPPLPSGPLVSCERHVRYPDGVCRPYAPSLSLSVSQTPASQALPAACSRIGNVLQESPLEHGPTAYLTRILCTCTIVHCPSLCRRCAVDATRSLPPPYHHPSDGLPLFPLWRWLHGRGRFRGPHGGRATG